MRRTNTLNPFTALIVIAFIGLAGAFVSPAGNDSRNACLWDYDTLRYEAQGVPGTIEAITGRFDRFPALYYEMRLERVSGELESDSTRLDLYDDAGVACDRLGRYDEAIGWMARKRAQLDLTPDETHEYRYLANLGTFHAHRWLGGGGDRSDLSDIETAADLISRAIDLNPDAHFGRERYQLLAIEWLRDLPDSSNEDRRGLPTIPTVFDADSRLAGYLSNMPRQGALERTGYDDAVEGLSGLITMGAAWESVDVMYALQVALIDQGDTSVAYLAWLRHEELRTESQRASSHPDFAVSIEKGVSPESFLPDSDGSAVKAYYESARREADAWRDSRNAYLLDRLASGIHPDEHPEFWADWTYTADAPVPPGSKKQGGPISTRAIVGFLGVLVGGVVVFTLVASLGIRWLYRWCTAKAHA